MRDRVFHLDRPHIQTLMYLKLSVAGHLTIFLTRTRGPFWSIRPAKSLLDRGARNADLRDSDCSLWIVHDAPGVGMGGFRLGLRLAWALLNDRVKLLAYRIFDPTQAPLLAKNAVDLKPRMITRHDTLNSTLSEAAATAHRAKTHFEEDCLTSKKENKI